MKLYFSPSSPYTRKVLVSAIELGIRDRIELLDCNVHMINRDQNVVARNPLGQVPTLILADGTGVYDSRVICEYLHMQVSGSQLFPSENAPRLRALVEQALADGLLNAALLGRQEITLRPKEKYWDAWSGAQMAKINDALDRYNKDVAALGVRVDIGTIAAACAISYLDFRYPDFDWRTSRKPLASWYETLSKRPSFEATQLGKRANEAGIAKSG
jgi:glutathione S-transferase